MPLLLYLYVSGCVWSHYTIQTRRHLVEVKGPRPPNPSMYPCLLCRVADDVLDGSLHTARTREPRPSIIRLG